jgi:hypothetical protein
MVQAMTEAIINLQALLVKSYLLNGRAERADGLSGHPRIASRFSGASVEFFGHRPPEKSQPP